MFVSMVAWLLAGSAHGAEVGERVDVQGSRTRITRVTPSDGRVLRSWNIAIDPELLVAMTSDASVRGCEEAFVAGAGTCSLQRSGCVTVIYQADAPRESAITLMLSPDVCAGPLLEARPRVGDGELEWKAHSVPDMALIATIPVAPSAGAVDGQP